MKLGLLVCEPWHLPKLPLVVIWKASEKTIFQQARTDLREGSVEKFRMRLIKFLFQTVNELIDVFVWVAFVIVQLEAMCLSCFFWVELRQKVLAKMFDSVPLSWKKSPIKRVCSAFDQCWKT